MTERQEVTASNSAPAQGKSRDEELVMRPPADIFEDAHGIMVVAEMPGVSKEGLNVQADRNSLLIEGNAVIDMAAGMEAVYADVQSTRYMRSFILSSELESVRAPSLGRCVHDRPSSSRVGDSVGQLTRRPAAPTLGREPRADRPRGSARGALGWS